jgi:hypothetical protein
MKKPLLLSVSILAILCFIGLVGWVLAGHGTIGLLRVTPVFLYALILVGLLGLALAGLLVLYLRNTRPEAGRRRGGVAVSLFTVSVICILLFSSLFVTLGGLPHAGDITPMPRLDISSGEADSLHFAVGADSHIGAGTNRPDETAAMLDYIGDPANAYDAFFFLGDMVEYGFRDNQWRAALDLFSPVAAQVPTLFAAGNHDTLFGGLNRYLAGCAPAAAPGASRLWYRVDAGRVHFIVLDVEWSAETVTKGQVKWLEEQLDDIPDEDWKIVFSHGFYYGSGTTVMGWDWYDNPETISALAAIFEKYGVDIVFSGHNHDLEYLEHSGVSYVVCGGFGGAPDPVPAYLSPASRWLKSGRSGFADISIAKGQAVLSFRGSDGDVLGTFTIPKR